MAKASKILHIGQPALSAQLKQLEESLATELFDRSKRNLQLTDVGHVVLDYANEIFRLGSELTDTIEKGIATGKSVLNIGAISCIPKVLLQQLIKAAVGQSTHLVRVFEGTAEFLTKELLAHRLDLFVSDYPPPVGGSQNIYSRMIGRAPIAIYGTKALQKDTQKKFPDSLNGQPFILPTKDSKFRNDLDYYFRSRKIDIHVVAETQDTSVQTILGIQGMGLVPLPIFASIQVVKDERLIKIGDLPDVHQDFWIIASHRKIKNPVSVNLMENFKLVL